MDAVKSRRRVGSVCVRDREKRERERTGSGSSAMGKNLPSERNCLLVEAARAADTGREVFCP
jgi:hypothetical protein